MSGPNDKTKYKRARLIALVSGLVSVVFGILVPFLPVHQTTAELNWPQATGPSAGVTNVEAPLTAYSPINMHIEIKCSVFNLIKNSPTSTVVLSTVPKNSPRPGDRALFIREYGTKDKPDQARGIEVVVRNNPFLSVAYSDLAKTPCSTLTVDSDKDKTTADFHGAFLHGKPAKAEIDGAWRRPQLTGLFTDLPHSTPRADISVHADIDNRYTTSPTLVKWIAIIVSIIAAIISFIALAALDLTDGRRHRRIFPRRWWRLNWRDAIVISVLVVWHFIGANTSDDGYILTMSRISDHAGYTANYYRWFGSPESPFGWYYEIFTLLGKVTTASPWIRLPALACGIIGWLIVSKEVIPRLGRAGKSAGVLWTAALTFLIFQMTYNNGLRPEPIIMLGALLTWCSVERAVSTRRLLPAATACLIGAFTLAAGPTGLMAVAALIAGSRPIFRNIGRHVNEMPGRATTRSRAVSYLAALAPIFAAGMLVIPVVFTPITYSSLLDRVKLQSAVGPDSSWYQELDRYGNSELLGQNPDGSVARRFAVLAMFLCIIICGAMLMRKSRIPGVPLGPSRRIVAVTFGSVLMLMFTPTKWTHHFGVFAGLGACLAALTAVAISHHSMKGARNRTLVTALVIFAAALSFMGPNSYWYVSNYGIPWKDSQISLGGIKVGNILFVISILVALYALLLHYRGPFTRRTRRFNVSPLITATLAVVVIEFVSLAVAGAVAQHSSYSVAKGNLNALAGKPCNMANFVLAEPNPNVGLLQPVVGSEGASLTGPGSFNFTPDGVPIDLTADATEGPVAAVGSVRTTNVNSDSGGLGGGTTILPGINGSHAKLPYGLDPAKVPVVGSYQSGTQAPAKLVTQWYKLPPASKDAPIIAIAAAGRISSNEVTLQYTTDPLKDPAAMRPATEKGLSLISVGEEPSWRNLRIARDSIPSNATAIRIVAKDNDLWINHWIALTPPRQSPLVTLQDLVGSTAPVMIDWSSGLAFPCQRPFNIKNGTAEIPKWRIEPDAGLSRVTTWWQGANGGGPLGWINQLREARTVPTYLRGDIGRDWGELEQYEPFLPAKPATIDYGHATRTGFWSPAPVNTG